MAAIGLFCSKGLSAQRIVCCIERGGKLDPTLSEVSLTVAPASTGSTLICDSVVTEALLEEDCEDLCRIIGLLLLTPVAATTAALRLLDNNLLLACGCVVPSSTLTSASADGGKRCDDCTSSVLKRAVLPDRSKDLACKCCLVESAGLGPGAAARR